MHYFIDAQQNSQISQANNTAYVAGNKAEDARNKTYELERRINRLALANQALWELLSERFGLTNEDLEAKILEVDLRDGVADGKMTQQIVECPQCRRKANSKRDNCFYCGETIPKQNVFE